jgi:8-oxo-dGTP pyrophosphatase MutT (NUDIX family)
MTTRPALDADWLRLLAQRIDTAPSAPRLPLALLVAGEPRAATIGSIESSLATQLAGAGYPLRGDGDRWTIELASQDAISRSLAGIAEWLHANGHIDGWRDELLAVTDAHANLVGLIERAAVRALGIATQAVHLVATDEAGAVWVQQRAHDKAVDPGRWDTTMGGLVAARESISQTLARETWEEAGLQTDELLALAPFGRFTVRRPVPDGYMVEHIHLFEATLPGAMQPVNQDGEVERFECLDRELLIERLHADAFTVEASAILAAWLKR